MDLLKQYHNGPNIALMVPKIIDATYIKKFVNEHKGMLKLKKENKLPFYKSASLKFHLPILDKGKSYIEDFDLLFISYIALFKCDFPEIQIEFHYPDFQTDNEDHFYRLNQHRIHLNTNLSIEIFKLYKGSSEYKDSALNPSVSYLPPIIVTKNNLKDLFQTRSSTTNYLKILDDVSKKLTTIPEKFKSTNDYATSLIKSEFNKISRRNLFDLSCLYFFEAISHIFILRHAIFQFKRINHDYQIGSSIKYSDDDKESPKRFKQEIYGCLLDEGVFSFSCMEMYFFSIIVKNSQLFEIPKDKDQIYLRIEHLLSDKEKIIVKGNDKLLKLKFIEVYKENLIRIINYTKDITYGLQELTKNIVEHTESQHGIITGRIYSWDRIKQLKEVEKKWIDKYDSNHRFLDINVIDSGHFSIKNVYLKNLANEQINDGKKIKDKVLKSKLKKEYESDISEISKNTLEYFFNFNSVKLFHQINRTKARLGLPIFSQTILKEKKSFVTITSNNLTESESEGIRIFEEHNQIISKKVKNTITLGTSYNFVIPVREKLEREVLLDSHDSKDLGLSSSVFAELHSMEYSSTSKQQLKKIELLSSQISTDKYQKLEDLKIQIGLIDNKKEIVVLDADHLTNILNNSSDWLRFFANLQFSESVHNIIIYNFDLSLYIELIKILKLFDGINSKATGFWKADKFILFFFPITNGAVPDKFWFNSVLGMTEYTEFIKLNSEINTYHLNANRILNIEDKGTEIKGKIKSPLFSSDGKLLNFELLIKPSNDLTLFEESMRSLVNITIDNFQNEN